jgi:molybdate transport system regulatory protein
VKRPAAPHLTGHLDIRTGTAAYLGDTRVRLLEAIAEHGSISQAAKQVPLSYKAAWDAVDAMNNLAEQPLVERSTGGKAGGGTRLTEHGRRVVALYRAMQAESQRGLDRATALLGQQLPEGDAASFQRLLRRLALRSSARNQFAGSVSALRAGPVDVEVVIRLDDRLELAAVVTQESAELLGLAVGREVVAMVKASSVMLVVDEALRISARNRFWGTVSRIVDGPVNAEVTLELGQGRSAVAVVTAESVRTMGLAEGVRAGAVFKVSSVILAVID